MFINRQTMLQIYNGSNRMDFPAISNFQNQPHSSGLIAGSKSTKAWMREAVDSLDAGGQAVQTGFVLIEGKHYLAGMTALPELGWYDLTLLDMSVFFPQFDFVRMMLVIVASTLLLLAILAFLLHRLVLEPSARLADVVSQIQRGDFSIASAQESSGEAQELAEKFRNMAAAVHSTQHWLETEIEKRTHQLSDARKVLEISLAHEREGRETQASLLALMAHEMRNPVAVIGNTAQMLKVLAQSESPDLLPRIEKIMGSVRRLSALMDNFLTEKWLDMDKHGPHFEQVNLNQACAEIAAHFADRPNQHVRFESVTGDALIDADWKLIEIAVTNLLDNACKYSAANSEILLRLLQPDANTFCVEVSNQGERIPTGLQMRIFEKYARGEHEGSIQGSGLGLYLVNWIAKFHGGHIEVLSIEGQRNTFRLYLPRSQLLLPTEDDIP
jgi:signal transduction histidine kinase